MRTRCWRILCAVVPLGVITCLPAARATLMRYMDLSELVGASDRIVVADVRTVQSAWDGFHRAIHTTVELSVRESWKGTSASDEAITIRQLGGTVGEIEMTVHGMPSFSVGERALLFLHGTHVVGMEQGKRRLRWEPATRRWLVTPADRSAAVLRAPRGKLRGTDADPAEELDSLRARIRSLVGN